MINYFKSAFSSEYDRDPAFIRLVRGVLTIAILAGAGISVLLFLLQDGIQVGFVVNSILVLLAGTSLFLSHRGIYWPGRFLIPLSILASAIYLPIVLHGLHGSTIIGFTLVIILTGLLVGQKAIPLATILSLLGVWTVAYTDMTGINHSAFASSTNLTDVMVISFVLLIVGGSLYGWMTRLNSALEISRINEKAQIKAVHELQELRAVLEQRVAERTNELRQANDGLQTAHEQLLQSEKQASLGRLASGVAHEINTPLAASRAALVEIRKLVEEYEVSLGNPEVTLDDYREISKELLQSLNLADKTLERIADFVHGIKAQTRDATPQERLHFNAIPVIRESLLLTNHALRAGHCTVDFEPGTETMELYGTPNQLSQIIINLLTNAIDASAEKGGGPITILLAQQDDWINMQISDQGIGIPLEIQSKVFDLLFTTKPVGRGTGLGLTIVRDILTDVFEGNIEVTSRVGEGTTFTLHFPHPHGDQNDA